MTSEERAQRAANNKSLRIIKTELEALAERGFITDEQYDTIINALPAEASLNGHVPATTNSNTTAIASDFAAMSVNDRTNPSPAPPSYQQAQTHQPPPPPPQPQAPAAREVAHAVALWAYSTPDARDLNFQPGDHISVTEFVNAEWWLGRNVRTGEEGIFPANYIRRENYPSPLAAAQAPPPSGGYYGDQKHYPGGQPQPYQAGPADPYANPVPPMAIAEQPTEAKPSKGAEMGKKFGKKLGNAAIFGAGATIGGNIVNSIF